ncbi:MAG TPA: nucleotidyltransferase domain-containing protein, partial [Mesotoga sp.]|nr:nucleotidyltransferase domain-containing protein [Mesotoga sp.]
MDKKIKEALLVRNERIIEAVIEKSVRVCPGSVALIGIYGSFATDDIHEKSDLDLFIVINDPDGYKISSCFILGDVAHDVYCTTWE